MLKVCILISLAIASACAQNVAPNDGESAPEPYSYGYETDTHAAAEQRDPSGKVTGYYTLADADGRQRRVEYVADEAGFRAKVLTNEVGTKSESSADVEVQAAQPTREQLVQTVQQQQTVAYQPQQAVAYQPQRVASQQVVAASQAAKSGVRYVQQPQTGYGYGYYPGYGYANQYGNQYGNQYAGYGVAGSPYGYGAYNNGQYYSTYNNHLPSSYYKSLGQTVQPVQYASNGVVGRYSTSSVGTPVLSSGNYRSYQTVGQAVVPQSVAYQTGYQTVGVPQSVSYQTVGVPQSVGYQTVGVPQSVGYQARSGYSTVGTTSNLLGSSNYVVLKKRDSVEATKETTK